MLGVIDGCGYLLVRTENLSSLMLLSIICLIISYEYGGEEREFISFVFFSEFFPQFGSVKLVC